MERFSKYEEAAEWLETQSVHICQDEPRYGYYVVGDAAEHERRVIRLANAVWEDRRTR